MNYKYVLLEKSDNVAIVTMNRPERLNALGPELSSDLRMAIEEVEKDPEIRAVILTGAGNRAFSVGADLKDPVVHASESITESIDMFTTWGAGDIEAMRKPIIAAINGYAIGGGMEHALSCDIMICSENASFQLPQTALGIIPGFAGPHLLRRVGKSFTMEMVLTGEIIDAQEALRIGLVNRILPNGELMSKAMTLARSIASKPTISVVLAKQSVARALELSLRDALLECGMTLFPLYGSQDRKEAARAFNEKREPRFTDQ